MQFKLTYYGNGLAVFVPTTTQDGWNQGTTLVIHNPPSELERQVGKTISVEALFGIAQRVGT